MKAKLISIVSKAASIVDRYAPGFISGCWLGLAIANAICGKYIDAGYQLLLFQAWATIAMFNRSSW